MKDRVSHSKFAWTLLKLFGPSTNPSTPALDQSVTNNTPGFGRLDKLQLQLGRCLAHQLQLDNQVQPCLLVIYLGHSYTSIWSDLQNEGGTSFSKGNKYCKANLVPKPGCNHTCFRSATAISLISKCCKILLVPIPDCYNGQGYHSEGHTRQSCTEFLTGLAKDTEWYLRWRIGWFERCN